MSPPRFKRATTSDSKDWSNADLDQLQVRVAACEDFCEQANDYMHDEDGDREDSPEEKVMREFFVDLAKDKMKEKLAGKAKDK